MSVVMTRIPTSSAPTNGYDLESILDVNLADRAPSGLDLADAPPARPSPRPPAVVDRAVRPAPQARPSPPVASGSRHTLTYAVGAVLAAAVVVAALFLAFRHTSVTDLVVADAERHPMHLADLRQGHPKLLLIFVLPGDYITAFVIRSLKAAPPRPDIAVAGLYVRSQAEAEKLHATLDTSFPIYGLEDAPDPFVVRDFLKSAGINPRRILGGTALLLDEKQNVVLSLEGEDVRSLPEKLLAVKE